MSRCGNSVWFAPTPGNNLIGVTQLVSFWVYIYKCVYSLFACPAGICLYHASWMLTKCRWWSVSLRVHCVAAEWTWREPQKAVFRIIQYIGPCFVQYEQEGLRCLKGWKLACHLSLWDPQKFVFLLFDSYAAVCDFLTNNNLLSVIRAHEAQDAG